MNNVRIFAGIMKFNHYTSYSEVITNHAGKDVLRQLQRSRHVPLVSDAQIYIDLKGQGLRSEEALEALEQCPDFCRNHEI